jgi:hypothetical protein
MATEYQMVAALLAQDIRIFAKAFPDNAQLQDLAEHARQVIENPVHRENRFRAGGIIYSLPVEASEALFSESSTPD